MKLNRFRRRLLTKITTGRPTVHILLSGAGVGKTTLCVALVERVRRQNPSAKIAALALTNATTSVLASRLGDHLERVEVRTFASFALGVLAANTGAILPHELIRSLGYEDDYVFDLEQGDLLATDNEVAGVVRRVAGEQNLSLSEGDLRSFQRYYTAIACGHSVAEERDWSKLLAAYVEHKRQHHLCDFIDVPIFLAALLRSQPRVRQLQQQRDYIILDECQDLTAPDWECVRLLKGAATRFVLVGDPRQFIFRFAGAVPNFVTRVQADYKGRCVVHHLGLNFRTGQTGLGLANALAAEMDHEFAPLRAATINGPGSLPLFHQPYSETEGTEVVVGRLQERHQLGHSYGTAAILLRGNRDLISADRLKKLKQGLTAAEIPYYRKSQVRELAAYGQIAADLICFADTPAAQIRVLAALKTKWTRRIAKDYLAGKRHDREADEILVSVRNIAAEIDLGARIPAAIALIRNHLPKLRPYRWDRLEPYFRSFRSSDALLQHWRVGLESACFAVDSVLVCSIHAMKGDQREAVFVFGVDDSTFPLLGFPNLAYDERALLYIASTRHRCELHMLHFTQLEIPLSRFLRRHKQHLSIVEPPPLKVWRPVSRVVTLEALLSGGLT